MFSFTAKRPAAQDRVGSATAYVESSDRSSLGLPDGGEPDLLPDALLDHVAGGGDSGCQKADWSTHRTIEGDGTN